MKGSPVWTGLCCITMIMATLATCRPADATKVVKRKIKHTLSETPGKFALAFRDLSSDASIRINSGKIYHAASTMKTAVLIELYRQAAEGKLAMSDSVMVRNQFKSIVDGSPYALKQRDDGEQTLYSRIGTKCTYDTLAYALITRSSNLATNILVDILGAANITGTVRSLGARSMKILRGVEDSLAYAKGWNNVTTADDLLTIFEGLALGKAGDTKSCASIIDILSHQQFNEVIPAELPPGITVAHKTGSFTGVHHDSGIVFLPDGRKYVLVILSRKLKDDKAAVKAMASVSKIIYDWEVGR